MGLLMSKSSLLFFYFFLMARNAEESGRDEIEVKVAVLGGEIKPVLLPEGATVANALEAAGQDPNSRVRVAGEEYSPEAIVEDGDRLTIVTNVKGGSFL